MARPKLKAALIAGVAIATLTAACSSSTSSTSADSPGSDSPGTAQAAISPAVDLAGICPSTVVVQTDWYPEADDFIPYQLAGPNGTVNTSNKSYTAELLASGKDTGVKIQVRAGGPAIGDQLVAAELYEWSILLGFVETDQAIELSNTQPTVAVVADRQQAPTIIAWSPAQHPGVKTIAQLGKTGTTVLYYNGAPYMDYLTGAGILSSKQVDGAYNGTPADFVASGGKDALQGFATAEPYEYSHEISQWDKPLTYQLVSDYGYDLHLGASHAPAEHHQVRGLLQEAGADHPAGNRRLRGEPRHRGQEQAIQEYNAGWSTMPVRAAYAAQTMVTDNIIANCPTAASVPSTTAGSPSSSRCLLRSTPRKVRRSRPA